MANILITGGSRGIGAANVRRLAREGHRVCFIYKESIETAHSLTRVLQAEGCDVIGVQCDVRQPSQVQKVVDTMNNNWGGVDVLINGAGISWTGLLQDMLDAEWLDLFDTNVNGTFYCTRAVLPHMLAQQKGVIINISSIWGSHPGSCEVAYSATKGAVDAFTRSLAQEVAYSGIRVNRHRTPVLCTQTWSKSSAKRPTPCSTPTCRCTATPTPKRSPASSATSSATKPAISLDRSSPSPADL